MFAGCRPLASSTRRTVKMIPTLYSTSTGAMLETPFAIHESTNRHRNPWIFVFRPRVWLDCIFFFWKARQPPRQHLQQSLWPKSPRNVLNRWRCKLTQVVEIGKNVSCIARHSHLPHWLYQLQFVFFSTHVYVSKGTWATTAYLRFLSTHDIPNKQAISV